MDLASGVWESFLGPFPGFTCICSRVCSAAHPGRAPRGLGVLSLPATEGPGLRLRCVFIAAPRSFAFLQQGLRCRQLGAACPPAPVPEAREPDVPRVASRGHGRLEQFIQLLAAA